MYNGYDMKTIKDLKYYKDLLPQELTVETTITEDGLVAEVKNFPHCYTQASNAMELIEIVNDAVMTYLEIPADIRIELRVIYLPENIYNELRTVQLQSALTEMLLKPPVASPSHYQRMVMC